MTNRVWLVVVLATASTCGASLPEASDDAHTTSTGDSSTTNPGESTMSGDTSGGDTSGDTDSATGTGDVDCSMPGWPDDIVVDVAAGTEIDFDAALVDVDAAHTTAFLCGAGHVTAMALPPMADRAPQSAVPWAALEGRDVSCKAIAVVDERDVVVLSSTGTVGLFRRGNDGQLAWQSELDLVPDRAFDAPAYDLAVGHGQIWVAIGEGGLVIVERQGDSLVEVSRLTASAVLGSRGVSFVGERVVIGDGAGTVRLIDRTGQQLDVFERERAGGVTRAVSDGVGRVALLHGGRGLDVLDVLDDRLVPRGYAIPLGVTTDVRFEPDDQIVLTTGSELARYALAPVNSDQPLVAISAERREGYATNDGEWFRTLTPRGPRFVATQRRWAPVELGAGDPAPRLWFDRGTYSTFTERAGSRSLVIVGAANRGTAPLILGEMTAEPPFTVELSTGPAPRPGCPGQFVVAPGSIFYLRVMFEPFDLTVHTASVEIQSDDPDRSITAIRVEGNRPSPTLGEPAIDYPMPMQSGRVFSIADYRGSHLLMKVFNTE